MNLTEKKKNQKYINNKLKNDLIKIKKKQENVREMRAMDLSGVIGRLATAAIQKVGLSDCERVQVGVAEQQQLELFDLLHLALDVLNVGVVGALQRGQLHSINDLERLAVVLERVCVRVLQIAHVLIEHDELATGFVKFDRGLLQLSFQILHLSYVELN